jgi:hypothetical protein
VPLRTGVDRLLSHVDRTGDRIAGWPGCCDGASGSRGPGRGSCPDLGLQYGAGDENRTRTVSLGLYGL